MEKNYTQISSCDTTSSGGTWLIFDTQDTTTYKEGSASLCGTMKSSGVNTATFTPSSAVDMSSQNHLRFWFLDSAAGLLDVTSNGGIRVGISDGTNTGYWYVAGSDTYDGGWLNVVIDVTSTVDDGTQPTNLSTISTIYIAINQTASGKNFDNVWIDNLCLCDGLTAYGDDSSDYFDFEDIYQADDTSLGIGIIRKIGGQYYSTGSIEIGDSAGTSGTMFQAMSQVLVFEDREVSSSLYDLSPVDNGTGTTEFILGNKVGTAGIQGCVIRTQSETQTPKFTIDGSGSNVDNFKLYGTTFFDAGVITLGNDATEVEVVSCSFESCDQLIMNDCNTSSCFFINTSSTAGAILWNETIQIADSSFVGNTTGAGIEMPSATGTPYSYNGLTFSGNTYDVNNTSGSAITVNKLSGSDPSTYTGSSVTFSASFTLTLTGIVEGTNVTIVNSSTRTVLQDTTCGASGEVTYGHSGGETVDILFMNTAYDPNLSDIYDLTLPNGDSSTKIQMIDDPNYNNP